MGQRDITVRPAARPDEPAVFDLASGMAITFAVDRDAFRETFGRLAGADGVLLLVVEVDGTVVGYALGYVHPAFFANGQVAWVEEISVDTRLRRQGLGAVLMREFEERAAAQGATLIALATRRAADFYGSLGYEPSATYFRKLL